MDGFFGIGIGELIMIAIVALIVLGPERLPGAFRQVAKFVRQVRNLSKEFTDQFGDEFKALEDLDPRRMLKEAIDSIDEEEEAKEKAEKAKTAPKKPVVKSSTTSKTTTKSATAKPATTKPGTAKPATAKTATAKSTTADNKAEAETGTETATAEDTEKSVTGTAQAAADTEAATATTVDDTTAPVRKEESAGMESSSSSDADTTGTVTSQNDDATADTATEQQIVPPQLLEATQKSAPQVPDRGEPAAHVVQRNGRPQEPATANATDAEQPSPVEKSVVADETAASPDRPAAVEHKVEHKNGTVTSTERKTVVEEDEPVPAEQPSVEEKQA